MLLERQDITLLNALQSNCRLSNAELAEVAGMSTSACWRRVKVLEEAGLVTAYTAQLDPKACGFQFQAIVHVQLERHEQAHAAGFEEAVMQRSEVLDCYATTGSADFHLRVLCRDLDAYNDFLDGFLFRQPAVANARTNLVLRQVKQSNRLPFNEKQAPAV